MDSASTLFCSIGLVGLRCAMAIALSRPRYRVHDTSALQYGFVFQELNDHGTLGTLFRSYMDKTTKSGDSCLTGVDSRVRKQHNSSKSAVNKYLDLRELPSG